MAENKQMEALPRIGCDMLHFAVLKSDTAEGATYDTAVHLANVKSVGFNPGSSVSTFYADDGPRVNFAQIGDQTVTVDRADLLPEEYALITGASYTKGLVRVGNPTPPAGAVMWRSQKSNGKYRYLRLLKTTFGVPQIDSKTKESSVDFQTQSIEGRNALRVYDSMGFDFIDEDDPKLDTSITKEVLDKEWFADPNFDPTKAYVAKQTGSK
jgi:phi13 family phage major tail protein|nr:MAG TPA: tail tube protein [Caudoviricetes sp.]